VCVQARSSTDGVALLLNPSPELSSSTFGGYDGILEVEMSGAVAPLSQRLQHTQHSQQNVPDNMQQHQSMVPSAVPLQRSATLCDTLQHTATHLQTSPAYHTPPHTVAHTPNVAPHNLYAPTVAVRAGNAGSGYTSRDGASPGAVRERLFQRCFLKIRGLQKLGVFNSWVANMRRFFVAVCCSVLRCVASKFVRCRT